MAAAMAARRVGPLPAAVDGLSIDSRSLAPGDAFFALKDVRDGHDFVPAALKAGAGLAVVAESRTADMPAGAPLLVVPDVLEALRALGSAARARSAARIAAVTGSVGKTSTKEALRLALSKDGETHASVASYNNHWGVPLSLARMKRSARYGVFEIGMNHAGEIEPLTKLVRPHVAIVTNVEPVHLEYFGKVEAIADAKAEIFLGLEPGGAAVLNRDNPHYQRLAAAAAARGIARVLGFGVHPESAVRLLDCHLHATASAVTAAVMGEIVDYCVAAPGKHWVMNSLAVLAAVKAAGGDVGAAAAALGTIVPMDGRGRRHKVKVRGGTAELIDESYNASPAAMRAALAVLGANMPDKGGRRIAVLGDMLELGTAAARLHAELAEPVLEAGIHLVFTVGPEMRALHDALPKKRRGVHADTAAAMAELLPERLQAGDVIMIKGSYGTRMREVVARLLSGADTVAVKG
jgi:UDP-N-acetylmuramoyl-tripeptide--D-alanyl-D-alanine ligase